MYISQHSLGVDKTKMIKKKGKFRD